MWIFIIFNKNIRYAIQACYHLTNLNREREIKGLQTAMQLFSIKNAIIITYDQEEIVNENIKIIPFWKVFSSNAVISELFDT